MYNPGSTINFREALEWTGLALLHFGPETKEIRELLRSSVARMVDVTWARDGSDNTHFAPFAANEGARMVKNLKHFEKAWFPVS
jgi:hypothetical protein